MCIQIKLDFINSDSADKFVEKGWDEEKQMYYYLVYFARKKMRKLEQNVIIRNILKNKKGMKSVAANSPISEYRGNGYDGYNGGKDGRNYYYKPAVAG